jgi:hypothetical protein
LRDLFRLHKNCATNSQSPWSKIGRVISEMNEEAQLGELTVQRSAIAFGVLAAGGWRIFAIVDGTQRGSGASYWTSRSRRAGVVWGCLAWCEGSGRNLGANRELAMKQLAVVICILATGLAISTPARADFAVVQFGDGYCRIWHDSADDPWGASWRKIAIGLPTWSAASVALDSARAQAVCP